MTFLLLAVGCSSVATPDESTDAATIDVEVYTGSCGETVYIDVGAGVPAIVSAYSCPASDGDAVRCRPVEVYRNADGVYDFDCDEGSYTATALIAL